MNNRERLGKLPLVELLTLISDRTHECMYKILSGIDGEQKRSRCHKMKNCQECLSTYLNEGGRKMYIDGEWYEECEAQAKFKELTTQLEETQGELLRAKTLIAQIRNFYKELLSWEMYEDDACELIGEEKDGDTKC